MQFALSLKQPWATLLVHGLKSIEVRRWSSPRTGPILIHAARVPDPRLEAWKHVPASLKAATELGGGIIGRAELMGCRKYVSLAEFERDAAIHLNDLSWFESPLYGFEFSDPQSLPFHRVPGNVRFFRVPEYPS